MIFNVMSYFLLGTKQYYTYVAVNSLMYSVIIAPLFAAIRAMQILVWAHSTLERPPASFLQRWGSAQAELSHGSMCVSVCSYGCE